MRLIHIFSIIFFSIVCSHPASAVQECGVILQAANLRNGPSTQFKSMTVLSEGTKIEKKKQQNDWMLIQVPSLGKSGWVHHQLIRNQQCKKFSPVKTIKPMAAKTTLSSAQQTKQILTAHEIPEAPPEVEKESVPTTKTETKSQNAPQNEITDKRDKTDVQATSPPTSTKKKTLPEPKALQVTMPFADEPDLAPLARPETPIRPSSAAFNRTAHPASVIGIIDIQKVINSSKRGKAARLKYDKLRLAGQREKIDLAEEELITNVIIEIQAIVETYSLQHGFTHILNKNSGAIFYNVSSYNITDDIIREYDRQVTLKHITP